MQILDRVREYRALLRQSLFASSAYACVRTVIIVVWFLLCVPTSVAQNAPAQLWLRTVTQPTGDPGLFNLQIDGNTVALNVQNGETAGPYIQSVGNHTVGETAATGTDLSNYTLFVAGDGAPDGT
jgi:hypothetical protein